MSCLATQDSKNIIKKDSDIELHNIMSATDSSSYSMADQKLDPISDNLTN